MRIQVYIGEIKYRFWQKREYLRVKGETYLDKKTAKEASENEVIKIIKRNSKSIAESMSNELFRRYQNWKGEE